MAEENTEVAEVTETAETTETVETTASTQPVDTVVETPEAEAVVTPSDWPEDWREKMSGGDEKYTEMLKRSASPAAFFTQHLNLQSRIDKGVEVNPFPNEGTDEEKTAWRGENGVPDTAAEYVKDNTLEGGLVIGEDDQAEVDAFLESSHAANESPEQVQRTLGTFFKMRDQSIADRMAVDAEDSVTCRDELRDEYGNDFQGNMMSAMTLLETAPEGVRDLVLGGRLSDGTAIGNHPGFLRWMIQTGLEINPASTLVPGVGADSMTNLATEIATIEKVQKEDRRAYFQDQTMQDRYLELITARDKITARDAA